ncbi:MAG: dephospho-CoA kinase [Actinomycetota bacterium]|nr:MAG: dephospho-CoA kinase [Actinomycetota bacterium]
MLRVALTGGIGSGKSSVARRFAELGAAVIDADAVAREVVEPGQPALAEIVTEFGPEVVGPDGRLDRAALAAIVFADRARLAKLNAITHPRIVARSDELAAAASPDAVLVYDVPLLAPESAARFDVVVVVDAPEEARLQRLAGRGLARADATARMASQPDRADLIALADIVIDNSGEPADLRRRVDEVWAELTTAR